MTHMAACEVTVARDSRMITVSDCYLVTATVCVSAEASDRMINVCEEKRFRKLLHSTLRDMRLVYLPNKN
jgi:hypothetical protein